MAKNDKKRLLVFAKSPVAGAVKTRLQPSYSPQQSVEFHNTLVHGCLQVATTVNDCVTELWAGSAHDWWAELSSRYQLDIFQQFGDDLGSRMLQAFQQTLVAADSALLIGTDCPFITREYLLEAFDKLAEYDVVIGPAEDGGYVLIGLTAEKPELFSDISWGSDQVLAETIAKIEVLNLSYVLLPPLRDIDRPEDVVYWQSSLVS
ncbi:MAG: TIGR04282 family arsenosugar biosynthesis glycosyltransferase [Oceanicoccus sp.]